MTGKIDIGKTIRDTLKSKNISIYEFAEKINCSQRNVYKIFNKRSLDTDMLHKIGKVLGKNFFTYYITEEELLDLVLSRHKSIELSNTVKELTTTVTLLKALKKKASKPNKTTL